MCLCSLSSATLPGVQMASDKSFWLVFRRSWVWISPGSWNFFHGFISHSLSQQKQNTHINIHKCLLSSKKLPDGENPSCLQATIASKPDQKSSHTVPQTSFQQTSTRPSYWLVPPTSLMSPSSQTPGGNIQIESMTCYLKSYDGITLSVFSRPCQNKLQCEHVHTHTDYLSIYIYIYIYTYIRPWFLIRV